MSMQIIGDLSITGKLSVDSDAVASQSSLATPYNPATSYVVGDFCVYEGKLYRCTVTTTGEFNPAHWLATSIVDEFVAAINGSY